MQNSSKNEFPENLYDNENPGISLKRSLLLIKNNFLLFAAIAAVIFLGAVYYAINAEDIYTCETTIKIDKNQGNILNSPLLPEYQEFGRDRFIANEIEIMKSYRLRLKIAGALADSFDRMKNKASLHLLVYSDKTEDNAVKLYPLNVIAKILESAVNIEQKKGLDIISIETKSPSPYESALIGNLYANEYREFNLELNRNQLTFVKDFLDKQKGEKQIELRNAEDSLKNFQEKGRVVALNEQATALIGELSDFEAQKNAAQIELMASDEVLEKYKNELEKQNPGMADYLESVTSETYITALQKQLTELQINKDLISSNDNPRVDITSKVNEYEQKISELRKKLDEQINIMKAGIFASSPAQVKELSQKIIEAEVKNRSLRITINGLNSVVNRYEQEFNSLPQTSIQFARFQRNRESLEKLYLLLEEKYQEALINEQSQPANVFIIDEAIVPLVPSKPNRISILLMGIAAGMALSIGFLYLKEYLNNKIKSPAEIEKKSINLLGWIPKVKYNQYLNHENSAAEMNGDDVVKAESFKSIRTRIQFYGNNKDSLKVLLVTSPSPQEGKTFVAVNLAESFAFSKKKTLIIDCDLRKPRVHSAFNSAKSPGITDFIFKIVEFNQILRPTETTDLFYVASGTIPGNPSEILVSQEMENFIYKLKDNFDYIIIDSPPILSVTDSEILSRLVDGIVLVIYANQTENEMMHRAIDTIKNYKTSFVGTVLNGFVYKKGYGSYYNNYQYYSSKDYDSKFNGDKEINLIP